MTDILSRLIAQRLSDRLRQQFVVENRTGAATNIATEAVAGAFPDGYTLLVATAANVINATLYEKLNFNFIRDLAPIASFGIAPQIMVVNPTVPARTVGEFIAYAKANPGRISYASGGVGSPPHAAGELFKMIAGVNITHVPYRGTNVAIPDMINGQVQLIFAFIPDVIEYVKAGNLRALAVTTATRLQTLPDLPTVSDSLPGFEATSLQGLCSPKSTPVAIVEKLNGEINIALADQKITARFEELPHRRSGIIFQRSTRAARPSSPSCAYYFSGLGRAGVALDDRGGYLVRAVMMRTSLRPPVRHGGSQANPPSRPTHHHSQKCVLARCSRLRSAGPPARSRFFAKLGSRSSEIRK